MQRERAPASPFLMPFFQGEKRRCNLTHLKQHMHIPGQIWRFLFQQISVDVQGKLSEFLGGRSGVAGILPWLGPKPLVLCITRYVHWFMECAQNIQIKSCPWRQSRTFQILSGCSQHIAMCALLGVRLLFKSVDVVICTQLHLKWILALDTVSKPHCDEGRDLCPTSPLLGKDPKVGRRLTAVYPRWPQLDSSKQSRRKLQTAHIFSHNSYMLIRLCGLTERSCNPGRQEEIADEIC